MIMLDYSIQCDIIHIDTIVQRNAVLYYIMICNITNIISIIYKNMISCISPKHKTTQHNTVQHSTPNILLHSQYLLTKASEVRESTAKAMSSDLRRIEMAHEQDMISLERQHKAEENNLREG